MGTATALAPGLSRKLKKVLETRTDTPDLLASLNTLSSFYSENTSHARRNLRSTIEKRGISINEEFLAASASAQQALDQVEEEVNALAECCDKIAKALNNCNATTGDIISTTERLKQELENTTQRQEIASFFLRDYQLSNDEINALREEELSENFFKALAHVHEIHANCKLLLRTHHQTTLGYWEGVANSETRKMLVRLWSGDQDLEIIKTKVLVRKMGHKLRHAKFCLCVAGSPNANACITMTIMNDNALDWNKFFVILEEIIEGNLGGKGCSIHYVAQKLRKRAGLELMDMMAVYQEGAYERLCRWVQAECRRLGDFDNPEVNELLRTAVRCLKARPVLFKYCAEEVANMRHNALFRRFISALTRGGPGGLPRPIEVHAHDPLRYVGDMLGWLHQALASERELVLALLDPDLVADTGPIAQRFSKIPESDSGKADSDLTFVLDRIFEGVCRPFKVRVEQVLQSQPSLIISYKLTITLEFYSHTISDLLGRETALCNTLWALKDAAQKTFFDIVKARGEKLLRYPPLVAVDLSPPPALREGVSVLLELIETYDSMMVPVSGEKPAFEPVISALLDPIIQMCEQAAEAHKSKGAIQSSRRSRVGSDTAQLRRSSIDAILDNSSSSSSFQIRETPSRIFLINCLSAVRQPLLGHDVASDYAKKLGTMIESNVRGLVEKEADMILRKCGLSNKMPHFYESSKPTSTQPLADIDDMSPPALSECLKAFFGLILGSENSLPEFEQMQVPSLRSEACIQLARSLADVYEVIYKGIMDPGNGYPDPRSLARHPPDQIRTILGI
ncbi:conserved oligomeric Golgi complex subunit [Striga asiatica]|uniref:Conserved oligomeric Golgi complex subunit 6 n=1 Tax=Striga asiatica TaxID=4170 RepID=A0A5A7RKA8_STRAF|nr:conserved oligomeric Golgi complex subunit [Striga asiatica]